MKKTVLALTVLALTAAAAAAQTPTPAGSPTPTERLGRGRHQGPKSPAQQADRHAARMAKELGLSADQEAKVEGILLAQRQEMQALKARSAGPAGRQALGPEAQAIRQKYEAQLRATLGADAYARYEQQREQRHDRLKQARAGREGREGRAKLKAKS